MMILATALWRSNFHRKAAYSHQNIWVLENSSQCKGWGSRRTLPCALFTFDLNCYVNILILFSTAGEVVFIAWISTGSLELRPTFIFSSEVRKKIIHRIFSVQLHGCRATIWQKYLCCRETQESALLQMHCESLVKVDVTRFDLKSQRRGVT